MVTHALASSLLAAEASERLDSNEVLTRWRDLLRLTLSENTERTYGRAAELFLRACRKPLLEVDEADVVHWLASFEPRSSTLVTYYYALRHLFRSCRRWGYMLFDPLEAIPAPTRDEKDPEALDTGQVAEVADYLLGRNVYWGLTVMFLYYTGLRIGEACSLPWTDVKPGLVVVRHTKGRKDRRVPLSLRGQQVTDALREWDARLVIPRCPETVRTWLREAQDATGVGLRLHPHLMRATFASVISCKAGRDSTFSIQKMLGHKNVKTTQRYVHVGEERMREDVGVL